MKKNTIKWKILKYNITIVILLITLIAIVFNIAVNKYIEKDLLSQLNKIALRTEDIALQKGPSFFSKSGMKPPKPPDNEKDSNNPYRFYFMLDQSLREPLSIINANYILLDDKKNKIVPYDEVYFKNSSDVLSKIEMQITTSTSLKNNTYLNFYISGTKYIALLKPVSQKNSFGLSWIIIYANLDKINQLQITICTMLFTILILSGIIIVIFSSIAAKKISAPFSYFDQHIKAIAERNFDTKIHSPVYDELQEFVNNINIMSEKLETYDKAQKTFLENASHEFRTPLMSIQSYAEGIKYDVVDTSTAVDIIIDETKRVTHLVEDLLYLSRLDTIEENYYFENLDYNTLINTCVERLNGIAATNNIKIEVTNVNENIQLFFDEEKLSRAITNIISNCIRYANSIVYVNSKIIDDDKIELIISDDGPGINSNDLPNVFERFYKGKKGNFGIGLAITKNVIEKHNGEIFAKACESGALFITHLPLNR